VVFAPLPNRAFAIISTGCRTCRSATVVNFSLKEPQVSTDLNNVSPTRLVFSMGYLLASWLESLVPNRMS
jgi:hypothetical protein